MLVTHAPDPAALGVTAAIDHGHAAMEGGAVELALAYFRRANELRPSRYTLSREGHCLRELGRLASAEAAYRRALDQPNIHDPRAVNGLIAVLCDQRKLRDALVLAEALVLEHPNDAAVLQVVIRVLNEFAASLEPDVDMSAVRARAAELQRRVSEIEGPAREERLHVRQQRAFSLPTVIPAPHDPPSPLVQPAFGHSVEAEPLDPLGLDSENARIKQGRVRAFFRRLLRRPG